MKSIKMRFDIDNYFNIRLKQFKDGSFGDIQAWTEIYFSNFVKELVEKAKKYLEVESKSSGSGLFMDKLVNSGKLSVLREIFGCDTNEELRLVVARISEVTKEVGEYGKGNF